MILTFFWIQLEQGTQSVLQTGWPLQQLQTRGEAAVAAPAAIEALESIAAAGSRLTPRNTKLTYIPNTGSPELPSWFCNLLR